MAEIISVINFDGDKDKLVYKYPKIDFNIGSQLIVHETQEAILFKDGKALDSFGPGRHTLNTDNFPILKDVVSKLASGESVFHCEIYFINLVTILGSKWGTDSKVRMFDPISGLHVEIGACGTFNLKVVDGRKLLLKAVGTSPSLDASMIFGPTAQIVGVFRGMIVSKIKSTLAKSIRENDINILEVDEHINELSDYLKAPINKVLEDYGMTMPEFFITTIQTPDDDPNFKRMKEQYAERFLKVQEQRIQEAEATAKQKVEEVKAETEKLKQVIQAQGEAEAIMAKGKAEAEVMRMKGYTYSEETARIVGTKIAENASIMEGGGSSIAGEIIKAGVGAGVGIQVAKSVSSSVSSMLPTDDKKETTWECPQCKHKNRVGSKFCEECGYKIDDSWTCPNCGASGLKSKFCPNCGFKKE